MSLQVRPLDNVGVEVGGFDINAPISDTLAKELKQIWLEHGIVLFRDQDIDPGKQIEFSRIFGPLEMHPLKATTNDEYPELFELVNEPGKDQYATAIYNGETLVNKLDWHMDLHYTGKPNHGAVLRAVVCASEKGLTGFGDLAKAWDALDTDKQALLEKLEIVYCFAMQRRNMRFVDMEGYQPGPHSPKNPAQMRFPNFPDVAYPAVVTHPITGRKVLEIVELNLDRVYAPARAGLCHDEAMDLLRELVAHIRRPEFHYFHEWREGDMVLWDNWRAMHCTTGTRPGVNRLIHRTTIAGDATLGRVLDEA
ncbi:TauD/TfdA dioxygenase family protein [Parahaliea mediterranea]|uniref:TauD/TfdA dioxygenase family protein n=1 Tax=Parahaliea mediterranea TaxID=651086 RepID=UPI000E2E909D|nr:TauD/TfdA family dioxygenase [Parahaliea mediterranea]